MSVVLISSSNKDTSHFGLASILMTSLELKYLFKNSISKYSHLPMSWGVSAFTCELSWAHYLARKSGLRDKEHNKTIGSLRKEEEVQRICWVLFPK